MAAYFVTADGSEYEWHVRELGKTISELAHMILFVQADGDELVEILSKITGLHGVRPDTKVRIVRWFGSEAQFIAGNLF